MSDGGLDSSFLERVRSDTEERWKSYVPRDFHAARAGGLDWRPGTRWRGGMTDEEINAAEHRYGLRFPPDYRLFLATLHTPDPPMVGAAFKGNRLVDRDGRAFVDWQGDPGDIHRRLDWPLAGILWSIEADDSWRRDWGPRPETSTAREAVVRRLAATGPQLIPVAHHQYLAGSPEAEGNPVLSIYGRDVIVIGSDLRQYVLQVLKLPPDPIPAVDRSDNGRTIPFWADIILDGLGS